MESYLVKGLLVGLVFGVPAGAIGALTIQRALSYGFWAGLFTGLGSSAADVLYACVGVFGLTVISDFLIDHQTAISLVGGGLIVGLGVVIFRKKAVIHTDTARRTPLSSCFAASFAVAIANPATVLSFLVAFSSFGIAAKPTASQGVQLVLGILVGTCCWWGLLSGTVSLFRNRITEGIYQKLNWILGGLLIAFGAVVALRTLLA